ncbi:unnamed protein product [Dovyalis caffra]|uniref:Uncharacterized protein n=1 Tax=Dovyalis caffra TaxID=77055 RepID=A0AAV1RXX2_9ROSI|nr:unnamed protein product [Dovyalis caffra]
MKKTLGAFNALISLGPKHSSHELIITSLSNFSPRLNSIQQDLSALPSPMNQPKAAPLTSGFSSYVVRISSFTSRISPSVTMISSSENTKSRESLSGLNEVQELEFRHDSLMLETYKIGAWMDFSRIHVSKRALHFFNLVKCSDSS